MMLLYVNSKLSDIEARKAITFIKPTVRNEKTNINKEHREIYKENKNITKEPKSI